MSNVSIHMNVDRRRTGQARVEGKVGANYHGVNVSKGPQPGDAYLQGQQNGETTTLRINSAFSDNGHGIFGRIAGVPFKGNWAQEPTEGDAELVLGNAKLNIDVNPETGVTESKGTQISSTSKVLNAEGDEELTLLSDGNRVDMTVDRQPGGKMDIRGRSGDGNFRVKIDSRGTPADLRIEGTLPEEFSLFPVMWELFGDDSVKRPDKPLSVGAVATMSAFWNLQLGG